jgi:predicted RNA-binding protein with RPS1 domain
MVGQEIPLKFLEVDQAKNRLVVSNRRAIVETQMRDLNPGEVVTGIVRGIKPYGAFIDIGGVSGLLHISQISHDHISDIESVLTVGAELKAMVISQVIRRAKPASRDEWAWPLPHAVAFVWLLLLFAHALTAENLSIRRTLPIATEFLSYLHTPFFRECAPGHERGWPGFQNP